MYRHLFLALLMTLGFLLGGRHVAQAAASFTFTSIDVPGASDTFPREINPSGQIVGFYYGTGRPHGFLYDGGVFTTIDPPGASQSQANGINPSGQIVGYYEDSMGGPHSFLYDGGVFTTLEPPDSFGGPAIGINPRGQIVGNYNDSTLRDLGFLVTPKKK